MVLAFGQHLFVRSEKLCKVSARWAKKQTCLHFSEPPPNLDPVKVKQTSAERKTKNEVFGFAYAECSQTYVKLVQGMFAIFPNRRLTSACPKLRKREPSAAKLI